MKKIIHNIKTYFDQKRNIPKEYPFIMYDEEKFLLKKYLSNSNQYLEFGTGGSTIFSLINSLAKITSVDTNKAWLAFMNKYKIIRKNNNERLEILYVDIGKTKAWGYPVSEKDKNKFENFSREIFQNRDNSKYDLILIDGRFRVACTLQSIINCYENENLFLLIHDYSLRENYKIVENFLDIVEYEKTLFVFKVKPNIDLNILEELYDKYKYIAD